MMYKGTLADGLPVVVKRTINCCVEGDANLFRKVEIINQVRHRNLVVVSETWR